jgi:Fe-S cluster assembly ATPase SufC
MCFMCMCGMILLDFTDSGLDLDVNSCVETMTVEARAHLCPFSLSQSDQPRESFDRVAFVIIARY